MAKSNAYEILDSIRIEAEARSLLQDLEKLITLNPESKCRFVWELIQNGKDSAFWEVGVKLSKTSTKPLDGNDEEITGKFGTGFMTTHVLNKVVIISGLLENDSGLHPFVFELNRNHDNIDSMKKALDDAYKKIEKIDESPVISTMHQPTRFEYELNAYSFEIAKKGLSALISNNESGLMFREKGRLIIAVPATKANNVWSLEKIKNQALLFKDFPLIGTEKYKIPVFLQNSHFEPSEPRDGLRIVTTMNEGDTIAESNRKALIDFRNEYIAFFRSLYEKRVKRIHLLADISLPKDPQNYVDKEWFKKQLLNPILNEISSEPIMKTYSGNWIKISDSKFPIFNGKTLLVFYHLVSAYFPDSCPDEESYEDWGNILKHHKDKWNVNFEIENLVRIVESKNSIDELPLSSPLKWMNDFYTTLDMMQKTRLMKEHKIIPNQRRVLKSWSNIYYDAFKDDQFKSIALNLDYDVYSILLHKEIKKPSEMSQLSPGAFFSKINQIISETQFSNQAKARVIFKLLSFLNANEWIQLCSDLLPGFSITKRESKDTVHYTYYTDCIKWTIEYVCKIVATSQFTNTFVHKYFQDNETLAFQWLNKLINYIQSTHVQPNNFVIIDNKYYSQKWTELYAVLPVQDGYFVEYSDDVFREYGIFPEDFKNWCRDYVEGGDPRAYLVDQRITVKSIRSKEVFVLTQKIDNLFQNTDCFEEVKTGKRLHRLYHLMNRWFEKNKDVAPSYFPFFASKRASLSLIAFGPEMSDRCLKLLFGNKSLQDYEAFESISLSVQQLKEIDEIVKNIGYNKILQLKNHY
ncbi:hypothetical protein B4U79_11805 [Dinothrombium tinctorium]|uniref:Uncharacterized protein n=1 Tax=Dinothrombium tinctorium TaxID=1965070 RepID=A0A3S3PCZ4_9ACAR|nr:hypothetical protein B4U79_11805 [Dinothrombium tinctorium]